MSPARRNLGAIGSLLKRQPISMGWFHHPAADAQLKRWTQEQKFDAVYLQSAAMTPYWQQHLQPAGVPAILDFIDVESERWRQDAANDRSPRRFIFAREQRHMLRFEREIVSQCHRCTLVSEAELHRFERAVGSKVGVEALSNGVDGGHFAIPELNRRLDPPRLVFVGQMNYGANVDAVTHFIAEIWPHLKAANPGLQFDIVGSRPVDEVLALRKEDGVQVTGWVEDVRPFLWRSTVAVVPLQRSQGTQNKVLEAMAASLPAVVSNAAADGLATSTREHLRIHDDPLDFAAAVQELLDNPAMAAIQANTALDAVAQDHSWDAAAAQLEALIVEASQS